MASTIVAACSLCQAESSCLFLPPVLPTEALLDPQSPKRTNGPVRRLHGCSYQQHDRVKRPTYDKARSACLSEPRSAEPESKAALKKAKVHPSCQIEKASGRLEVLD